MKSIAISIQEIKNGLLVTASKYDSDYGYDPGYETCSNQQVYAANTQEAAVVVQTALADMLSA